MVGRDVCRAAALVDGDVDQHRPALHVLDQLLGDELGRRGARHQHRADDEIGLQHIVLDRLARGEDGVDGGAELLVDGVEPVDVDVEHGQLRLEPDPHAHRVDAGHAAAQHDDLGGRHAGGAAEQHAAPALLHLQAMRAGLDGHAAGNLAHRRQQRQAAAHARHRLVGDGRDARGHQRLGLLGVGRQVQIGKERLALAQHGAFGGLRLLHLHDEIGLGEHLRSRAEHLGTGPRVVLVGEALAGSGVMLHEHLVPVLHRLAHAGRRHADAILVDLDLLRHADAHLRVSGSGPPGLCPGDHVTANSGLASGTSLTCLASASSPRGIGPP